MAILNSSESYFVYKFCIAGLLYLFTIYIPMIMATLKKKVQKHSHAVQKYVTRGSRGSKQQSPPSKRQSTMLF